MTNVVKVGGKCNLEAFFPNKAKCKPQRRTRCKPQFKTNKQKKKKIQNNSNQQSKRIIGASAKYNFLYSRTLDGEKFTIQNFISFLIIFSAAQRLYLI